MEILGDDRRLAQGLLSSVATVHPGLVQGSCSSTTWGEARSPFGLWDGAIGPALPLWFGFCAGRGNASLPLGCLHLVIWQLLSKPAQWHAAQESDSSQLHLVCELQEGAVNVSTWLRPVRMS
ncbi:hypothetical protein EK904_001647 [Melospiza melodia maxima]|nr:hypothetical protein EK904_001647 [Melospiza melodia maxima]